MGKKGQFEGRVTSFGGEGFKLLRQQEAQEVSQRKSDS